MCRAAGELICGHYNAPEAHAFEAKGDDSPLTRADLASHAVLQAGLRALDPGLPVLSEESAPADIAQRRQWHRYWLVDPLDGTKEFLARTGEFTINIALIDNHRPVLGVLYLPLERVAYVGIPGVAGAPLQRRRGRYLVGQRTGDTQLADRPADAGAGQSAAQRQPLAGVPGSGWANTGGLCPDAIWVAH